MFRPSPRKGNNVLLDFKAQRSSEQTNTLSFCPRSCCSNLKHPVWNKYEAVASAVGSGDAGGAEGASGVCMRYI